MTGRGNWRAMRHLLVHEGRGLRSPPDRMCGSVMDSQCSGRFSCPSRAEAVNLAFQEGREFGADLSFSVSIRPATLEDTLATLFGESSKLTRSMSGSKGERPSH